MEEGVDAALASHSDVLKLGFEGGKQVLAHILTQEKVALPAAPGDAEWDLCFVDDEGSKLGYLDAGDESIWAQDLLKLGVYVDAGGVHWLVSKAGVIKTLTDYRAEHDNVKVTVRKPPDGSAAEMRVALFRLRSGARLWWSLKDLYTTCGLKVKGGLASKWVHSGVPGWRNYCSQLDLAGVHLRMSQPLATEGAGAASPDVLSDRVLGFPSVSTHMLLALCARLAAKPKEAGGLETNEGKVAVSHFLEGLLKLPAEEAALDIYLDPDPMWQPPLKPQGTRLVSLKCSSTGILDLGPLHAALREPGGGQCAGTLRGLVASWGAFLPLHAVVSKAATFPKEAPSIPNNT